MKKLLCILLSCISMNVYAHNCGGEFDPISGSCRIIGPDGRQIIYNSDPPQSGSISTQTRKIIRHVTVDVPSKYGAIAHNPKTGVAGGSIDMTSLQEAKKEAIKRCENGGKNAPCKVVAWVRNGCLATAKGILGKSGRLFKAVAKQPGQVERLVLNQCTSSGASGCKIYAPEGCSIPDGMYNN